MAENQRNQSCSCGSGRKYKKCCMRKTEVTHHADDSKTYHLNEELVDILKEQQVRREAQLGRPLRPDDTVFDPEEVKKAMEALPELLRQGGMDPALAYAVEKTGRTVTEENMHLLTPEDLQEWHDAIDEYEENQEL